jgi:predicted RNase H-like nuclease (RuvC/YqgF family)
MDENKISDMLLVLMQDIAVIKAKLDSIEEIKLDTKSLGNRVDHLEAQNREHDRIIKSLENRANTMEKFTRDNMNDAKKQQTSVFISVGMAIFSAVLSLVIGFLR